MATQRNAASTQGNFDENSYLEEWVVMVNGFQYKLDKAQNETLSDAIGKGNRGIIMFEGFSISIPYIQEHYRSRRYLKANRQLEAPPEREIILTPEELAARKQRMDKMRKEVYAKLGKKIK